MGSFRTRGGQCRITDDAIHIDGSYVGRIKRHYDENKLLTLLWLISPLYVVYFLIQVDRDVYVLSLGLGIGLAVGGTYLAFGYVYNYVRDFTYDDRIQRDAIETIKPVSGTKGISRPRFIVKYERDGERKNRYIQMSSKFGYGDEEFEKAKDLFQSVGLPLEQT
jgi:hypothetical protein